MKSNRKKKLLILSVIAGTGHIRAAEALTKVANEKFDMEVNHVNFLDYMNPGLGRFLERLWYLMVRYTPMITKVTYESGKFKSNKWFKNLGDSLDLDFKKYRDLIRDYKPDLIVSTHYLPAVMISWMYRDLPIKNGVVITDYTSHSMWVYPNNNLIFVACDEVVGELKKMGIKKDKICVSGIPVGDVFLKPFDRVELRKELGLKIKKPLLLLMGGGDGVGPFVEIMNSLSDFKNLFQLVVVAGKDKKKKKDLEIRFKNFGFEGEVVGFVKNIDEYMKTADLLISKAGGLTVTEAITVGLPVLVVRPTPGQEDGNTNFLVKSGAGIHIKNITKIGMVVEKLLKEPKKIKEMSNNAKRISRPQASEIILEKMLELLQKVPPKV